MAMYLGHDKVSGSFGDTYPLGVISDFAGLQIPYGWLLCDGRELSRTEYAPLFEVIGTTYGEGDGETTFNLPNIKGRVTVAVDESQEEFAELGKLGGSKYLQSHSHAYTAEGHTAKIPGFVWGSEGTEFNIVKEGWKSETPGPAGTGDSENLQPYIVVNKIIKASNVMYVLDKKDALVVDSLEENSTTNAPSQRAVNDGIKVSGKASKNLFNSRTAVSTSNITVLDNKNGVVELRGVSSYWNTLKVPIYLTKNTTYTIRSEYTKADDGAPLIDILDANNNAIRENYYATDNTLGGNFTTNSELNYIVFRCNGATNTGYVKYLNVQLEEGSTATEYEDYCKPSVCIKDSKGNNHDLPYATGKVSKNLLSLWEQGGITGATGAEFTATNRIRTPNYISVIPNEDYFVSVQNQDYAFLNIILYDKSSNYIGEYYNGVNSAINGANKLKVVFPSECYKIRVVLKRNDDGNLTPDDVGTARPQIEKSSTATSYEEYYEPSLSIKNSNGVFQEVELNTPVILYTSKTGTFDPITLAEEAEHFKYVEVFGVGNTMICSVKIPMDLYNTGSLFTAGASYQYQCGVSLTGKSMTFIYNRRLNISSNAWDNGNYFKIYRIIGYR